jgi:hypothetical protein
MLQGCQHKVVTILLYQACNGEEQPCNKSDNFDKVVTSCQQVVPNLLTTYNKQCEYTLLTACWHTCYKMWDFYVCTLWQLFLCSAYASQTCRCLWKVVKQFMRFMTSVGENWCAFKIFRLNGFKIWKLVKNRAEQWCWRRKLGRGGWQIGLDILSGWTMEIVYVYSMKRRYQ